PAGFPISDGVSGKGSATSRRGSRARRARRNRSPRRAGTGAPRNLAPAVDRPATTSAPLWRPGMPGWRETGRFAASELQAQLGLPGTPAVFLIAGQYFLHVLPRLPVRRDATVTGHSRRTGVVGGQRELQVAVILREQAAEVTAPHVDVGVRVEEIAGAVGLSHGRTNLHQTPRAFGRYGLGREAGLDRHDGGDEQPVDAVALGGERDGGAVGQAAQEAALDLRVGSGLKQRDLARPRCGGGHEVLRQDDMETAVARPRA